MVLLHYQASDNEYYIMQYTLHLGGYKQQLLAYAKCKNSRYKYCNYKNPAWWSLVSHCKITGK
jgi:hypothetical protein